MKTRNTQGGITLIVTLIFLVILAIFGVTAMRSNSLQERMAGNTRNRDLALQAAEHALRDAESTLTTWRTSTFPASGCTDGLCARDDNRDANYWRNPDNWSSYRTPADTVNQVAEQPRYIIEKLPETSEGTPAASYEHYRITARGVGGDINAIVVLQTELRFQI
jgi:type IV pilus assembly protein PilX